MARSTLSPFIGAVIVLWRHRWLGHSVLSEHLSIPGHLGVVALLFSISRRTDSVGGRKKLQPSFSVSLSVPLSLDGLQGRQAREGGLGMAGQPLCSVSSVSPACNTYNIFFLA